jgi:ATP-binding cassette subfamily F protein uup
VRDRVDLGTGRELTAGQLCETFGFNKEKQWTPVGDLSGGERRRLQLLRLLMDEPNVLFLDEPTNDLDIETLTQLEDVLDGWPGSMVVISHDRFFIERTTDKVFALLGDAALRMLPRGIDEYLERRHKMEEVAAAAVLAAAPAPAKSGSAADARVAKKELQKIERQLDKVSEKETRLHAQIADNATDFGKVAKLDAELRQLTGEREELELRWLELAEDA